MLKKNMISCVVLDIDDTLVSKDCLDTVVSYVALVAGTVVLALGYVLQGVLLVALSTLRLWSLPRLPPATKAVLKQIKSKRIPIYISTARWWPLVTPRLLSEIGIPFSHVFFRETWDKPESKLRNLSRIQSLTNLSPQNILFIDNELSNIERTKSAGYNTIHVPFGLQKNTIENIEL